jgi:hypothetical protein
MTMQYKNNSPSRRQRCKVPTWPPLELMLPSLDELERLGRGDIAGQQLELFEPAIDAPQARRRLQEARRLAAGAIGT